MDQETIGVSLGPASIVIQRDRIGLGVGRGRVFGGAEAGKKKDKRKQPFLSGQKELNTLVLNIAER